MSKKMAEKIHAKRRAKERYDLELNRHSLKDLVKLVQSCTGIFIRKKSNRVSNWLINYQGKDLLVSYDKIRKTIITFLPLESIPDSIGEDNYLTEETS